MYLGVHLSTNLNFNTHIKRISSNANKLLGFIKRNIKTKHTGAPESHNSTVWSPCTLIKLKWYMYSEGPFDCAWPCCHSASTIFPIAKYVPPLALRQIYTSVNFYKYSFPPGCCAINKLPANVVMLPTQPQFSVAVRSLDHQLP